MASVSLNTRSHLLDQFNDFYQHILKARDGILAREAMENTMTPPPEEIALELTRSLEQSANQMKSIPMSGRRLQEAQYAMVALADETILNIDWSGRDAWLEEPLEARFYQSHEAGERVFKKIDELLYRNDPDDVELARIYLMTLALDFRGRFRDHDPHDERAAYLNNLHYFIFKRPPAFKDEDTRLFPSAYEATLSRVDPPRYRRRSNNLLLGSVFFVLFLIFTHLLWLQVSQPLKQVVGQIIKLESSQDEEN
jgi:type VI secretion system protein ImpK